MACLNWCLQNWVLVVFAIFFAVPFGSGFTDPRDVFAVNQLYVSLGSPPLPGWVAVGGDPCGPPSWQGVECVICNITAIKLNGANLGGELPADLAFESIILINLSNNHIGGTISSKLPATLRSIFLSDNEFTGSIPDALSSLGQLTDLSLNDNQLTGAIPDAFVQLTYLINMDLSGNSLTGELPPSMGNLSSLTTLHLQNNQLSGMLDVLQDLPLIDLNIINNLFSGPIPNQLLNIPNFRRAGNPFNTTVLPSPPSSPPPLSPSDAPSPQHPRAQIDGSSTSPLPQTGQSDRKDTSNKVTWIAIGGLVLVAVLFVGLCLLMFKCCKGRRLSEKTPKGHGLGTYDIFGATHKRGQSSENLFAPVEKGPQEATKEMQPAVGSNQRKTALVKQGNDHSIDVNKLVNKERPNNSLRFPLIPADRIVSDPTFTPLTPRSLVPKNVDGVKFFAVSSLQQYTNSFSQENLIGKGTLGTVYRAELPDGKVLAVKKLDKAAIGHLSDREFLELISSVSKLRHPNIVELVGYCLEHGQRLLVYNYCRNGTLNEALHLDEEIKERLSWNARMRLALQAAKALEYMHEVCQPPIVHQNFKSANVLLEDDLSIRVSDCGLAPLLSPSSMSQLQGSGYGAPELELGYYSCQSDVYSFGVVMLELLTGRKSYDRFRPRGEQYLVRWAFSRLHDIDSLSRMVDPSLNGSYPSKSLSRVADIISLCIQAEPEFRPPMSEIVQKLSHMTQSNRC